MAFFFVLFLLTIIIDTHNKKFSQLSVTLLTFAFFRVYCVVYAQTS